MAKNPGKQSSQTPVSARGAGATHSFAIDRGIVIPIALAFVIFAAAILVFPFPASVHDAYSYEVTALRLIQDHIFAYSGALPGTPIAPNANVTPGMVMVLAAFFLPVLGSNPTAGAASAAIEPWLVGIQFLAALGIVLAVTLTGRLIRGQLLGLVAGILAACYLPFAWASTVALNEQLGTLLFAWQIYLGLYLVSSKAKHPRALMFAYGLLAGTTLMFRPALAFWAPVPLVYMALSRTVPVRQLLWLVLSAAAGFILIFSPWWIRNQNVVGTFTLFRSDTTVAAVVTPAPHDPGPMNNGIAAQLDVADKAEGDMVVTVVGRQGSAGRTPLAKTAESLLTPWVPQLAVTWEDLADPDQARFGYKEPATYSLPTLARLAEAVRFYQWLLLLAAIASLLVVRARPQILIVLAAPVLVIAAHYSTQMSVRYLYPAMPAIVVLAACGVLALWSLARKARS